VYGKLSASKRGIKWVLSTTIAPGLFGKPEKFASPEKKGVSQALLAITQMKGEKRKGRGRTTGHIASYTALDPGSRDSRQRFLIGGKSSGSMRGRFRCILLGGSVEWRKILL
jgi:hypothetical protein